MELKRRGGVEVGGIALHWRHAQAGSGLEQMQGKVILKIKV